MDSDQYFKIVSEFGNVIHIKPQGNWTDDIADIFGAELKDKFKKAVAEMNSKGRRFIVLANMSSFHIDGEKTQQLLTELMQTSVGDKMFFRTVQIIPDPKTRQEIQAASELAGQTSVKFVVASMDEANKKILELKKELFNVL